MDVILDVVGGDYLDRNLDALALKGRIIQVGVMNPGPATFSLGKLLPKRATLMGTVLRSRPLEEKIAVARAFSREVLAGFDDGRFVPVIDRRYPLDQVGEAQDYLAANDSFGKVLIDL